MPNLWAPQAMFERCLKCATTRYEHKGHGLCFKCYHVEKHRGRLSYWKEYGKQFKKWSRNYDQCVQCGTTSRLHVSHGLCNRCRKTAMRRSSGVKEKPNNFRMSRWAYNYDACICCGTSDRSIRQNRHAGKGLCMRCRRRLAERMEKGISDEAACEICGWKREIIDVCHLIPARAQGGLGPENRVFLCPNHHRLMDAGKLTEEEMMRIHHKVAAAVWRGINGFIGLEV